MPTSPTLRDWLAVLFWIGVIALESGFGSSARTAGLLLPVLTWLFGHIDPVRFAIFHHLLRKIGHFLGYGILGFLWLRALTDTLRSRSRATVAALAIAGTFVIAALDEWHQSISPGRTGQFSDVILDTCGAIVLVGLALLLHSRRNSRKQYPQPDVASH